MRTGPRAVGRTDEAFDPPITMAAPTPGRARLRGRRAGVRRPERHHDQPLSTEAGIATVERRRRRDPRPGRRTVPDPPRPPAALDAHRPRCDSPGLRITGQTREGHGEPD